MVVNKKLPCCNPVADNMLCVAHCAITDQLIMAKSDQMNITKAIISLRFLPIVMNCTFGIALGILMPIAFTLFAWFVIYLYVVWEAHQHHSDDLVRWKNKALREIKF